MNVECLLVLACVTCEFEQWMLDFGVPLVLGDA